MNGPDKISEHSSSSLFLISCKLTSRLSEIRHPTTLVQGMYIYKEIEIAEAKGIEKKRRIFWNEKCDEICKNGKYNS